MRKDQILYRQGETADSLYIIKSGRISLFVNGPHGRIRLMRLGAGQIVGDLSFFTGSPRSSDAVAMIDTECTQVSYESVRSQFEAVPAWIKSIAKTLATQVQSYSAEIKPLRDHEDAGAAGMPRLIIARAWAALTLVPHQFGTRDGEEISIDWPTLRSFSNLCFREISERVVQLANALTPLGFCAVRADATGPTEIVLKEPKLFADFLAFYRHAIIEDKAALDSVRDEEYETMNILASPQLQTTPIHRGQVEIDLAQFMETANTLGHAHVTATSVDLLSTYGVEVTKIQTETGVKIRFHQEEVVNRAKFWRILKTLQEMNTPKKLEDAA